MIAFLGEMLQHPVVQGALGSAVFWVILQGLTYVASKGPAFFGMLKKQSIQNRFVREWVYRKYTNSSGLAFYSQGYFVTFHEVLKSFLQGLIFICVALLIGSGSDVVYSICLIGGIYFLFKGLTWLQPSIHWKRDWNRIKELEEQLFGKPRNDTLQMLQEDEETRE